MDIYTDNIQNLPELDKLTQRVTQREKGNAKGHSTLVGA